MSRRKNLIPSIQLNVALPEDIWLKLTSVLFSDLEQRVPHGAYQKYLVDLLRERFESKPLDLAGLIPGVELDTFRVSGSPEAILALRYYLESKL